ncbi:MAG: proline dehydrogenase family protein [Nitrospirae bacterium]|jgi:RHH-type proline utilization regulon transcriptional repressor/proline dehydrogenase/delta 1-pyrroline-5-carboxylate dehydrogenase|nr:proline dehydrogenase family protein [Nitrospirota bacterium]
MPSREERSIREIGQELYRRMSGRSPALFSGWEGGLLKRAQADPGFQTSLFFLIDVLPALSGPAEIRRHIEEYLPSDLPGGLSGWAGIGARFVPGMAERIGRRLIVPEDDIVDVVCALERRGLFSSVDLVGEEAVSDREADRTRDRYRTLLDRFDLHPPSNPLHLSLKPSSLNPDMNPLDPEGAAGVIGDRLAPVLQRLARVGGGLVLDMEQRDRKEIVLALFRRIQSDSPLRSESVGIALQAYLPETSRDLEELIAWGRKRGRRFPVRLVKGAYWDQEMAVAEQNNWPVPVFARQGETDAHYERLVDKLVNADDTVIPCFATHNLRTVSCAVSALKRNGRTSGEFHLLYGMSEPLQDALRDMGLPVRVYLPAGDILSGMAYLIRRLLENTANTSFLRRQFLSGEDPDTLLAPPPPIFPDRATKGRPSSRKPFPEEAFENEPLLDFSRGENRALFRLALSRVKESLGRDFGPRISGQETEGGGETVLSVDPSAPGRSIGDVRLAGGEDVRQALEEACRFRETWQRTPLPVRTSILLRAADVLRRRRLELSAREVFEVGKSWPEADADVCEAIDFCTYYARSAERYGETALPGIRGEKNRLCHEGRGVVLVLPPWNFPLAIPAGMTAAALVTGNVVLLKPSLEAPVIGSLLVDALLEAGVPPGAIHYLPGKGETLGRDLAAHPDVDMIAFTGSKSVGLSLLGLIGQPLPGQKNLKHVVCEMGGKNAIVVDDDADLDLAVPAILSSAFSYQGQKCSACSRVIAVGRIHDRLVERLVRGTEALKIGPPENPESRIGPVISARARDRVRGYIEKGREEGELLLERRLPKGAFESGGYYVGPAIFGNIRPHHVLAREEIFGPVLSVMKATDFREGIALAVDCDYRLTGGVFSRSPSHIDEAEQAFRVGNLYVNRGITGSRVGRQPFGGLGFSGWGSQTGGPEYLLSFMTSRVITENLLRHGCIAEGEEE